jgi:virginiamycin B lyase
VSTSGTVTEFPVPVVGARPWGITAGPGGMWFTLSVAHRVGLISPTGAMDLFPLPKGYSPRWITLGPDGNLWFSIDGSSLYECSEFGRITASGVITQFNLPTCVSGPFPIAPGPDGNVWFSIGLHIGYITPAGAVTEYDLQQDAASLTLGPDGAIWFGSYNSMGRLIP